MRAVLIVHVISRIEIYGIITHYSFFHEKKKSLVLISMVLEDWSVELPLNLLNKLCGEMLLVRNPYCRSFNFKILSQG